MILIVPMTMLSALFGVWLTGGDNNVFVQVGLVVLMGLACKNAILIVEFARELEMQGKGIVEAALEACRLRLRPIVMTSIAFIAGTIPLILGHGAGAEVRGVTGITVFSGMLGVTLFGLFLTPVFYVTLRRPVARSAAAGGVIIVLTCKRSGIARPFYACEPRLFTGGFGLLLGGVFRAGALVAPLQFGQRIGHGMARQHRERSLLGLVHHRFEIPAGVGAHRAAGRHLRAGSPDALVVDHRQIDVPQGDLFRRAAEVNRAVSARWKR